MTTAGGSPQRSDRAFVPALRFHVLTPAFDTIIKLSARERTVKNALLDAANLGQASEALDVGCGTGTLAIEAKRRYPHLTVAGVDPDPRILTRARAKARKAGVDVEFRVGSATTLPMPDGSFDRVLSTLVFHHLTTEQKRTAAAEVARVLLPGGEFHLADWVQPSNQVMRLLFLSVQLLDGRETTRDHLEGHLLELLARPELVAMAQHQTVATPAGTVGLISARKCVPSLT